MTTTRPFRDRAAAGRALAKPFVSYQGRPDAVVLGLPPGGVTVALEVARFLHLPLDAFFVRRLVLTRAPERVVGLVASGGVRLLDEETLREATVSPQELGELLGRETAELDRQERRCRAGRPALNLAGRLVLLIDEGLATGATMSSALRALAAHRPARVLVGVPVGEASACAAIAPRANDLICLARPDPFFAVGCWYDHFPQLGEAEVGACLEQAAETAVFAERAGLPGRHYRDDFPAG